MKTIIHYECGICRYRYLDEASARQCEAGGKAPKFQIGTIFNNAGNRQNFYKGITFVVAKNNCDRHSNYVALWALRDNGAGDSLGKKDLCGGRNMTPLGKSDVPDRNHPTFKRAVAFLKKHKIKAYVWDGKESKPL